MKVAILVENLSVPFDRRVWQEAQALRDAGGEVAVICPRGDRRDTEPHERLQGVDIFRYALVPATGGAGGYVREYATAFRQTARLLRRVWGAAPIDVLHACNPPDLLLAVGLPYRRAGLRFVFDQHDLIPELVLSRFGSDKRALHRVTRVAERCTFALADVVLATNESYRAVALTRGRKRPEDVFVVRSAPDLDRWAPVAPDPSRRRGKRHLLAYLGVMGPQDGVDYALRALAHLHAVRDDWHAVFVGDGDVGPQMRRYAGELGLGAVTEFTGRVPDDEALAILSSADVCLAPDPRNPLNDVSTMNKILEYMAVGAPVVSFDLREARASAGEAALYATPNSEESFGSEIAKLLDDGDARRRMGEIGRRRIEGELSWERSKVELLRAYERCLSRR